MTTMTTTPSIKCGNCKATHGSVADVKACYAGTPVAHVAPTAPVVQAEQGGKPATAKQIAFIERLRAERGQTSTLVPATSKVASAWIETLLAMPKAAPAQHPEAQATKAEPLTDGMYRQGDTIFKIQKAVHGSGHLYAKRLVPGDGYGAKATFVYAPGAMKALTLADKMTLEEAKAWGALYGTCCVCGRTLTNESSIEAGIGPVCAGKF